MATVKPEIADKLLSFYRQALLAGIDLKAAYLYGSHARGAASECSDIDVAVITARGREDADLLWRIRRTIDVLIEPVVFSPKSFALESPLVWEIVNHGIKIVDDGRWQL